MRAKSSSHQGRQLADKLGIKEGSRIIILDPPSNYGELMGELPRNVTIMNKLRGPLDFIHFFTKNQKELQAKFPILKRELAQNGGLWVSWPKGSSGMKADLNESIVREIGLRNGLVDVKIIAVDEIWSGLKFVYRLRDRK